MNAMKAKLVGSEEERAVSPVIGVILMVAITVILAAVIAAFVLDLGGSVGQEAQAGVTIDVDESADEIQVEVTSLGNADSVHLGGSLFSGPDAAYNDPSSADDAQDATEGTGVGDVITISTDADADIQIEAGSAGDIESGTVTAVAVIDETDTTTQVASEDYDLDWS
ncbi:type IV pilin N-terminal domain-containing protein [Natrialba sp. INN-245]|uniref:type IV pilin n=1 Tax=Natrialba sp. INN-245 TaxID=2690967 RepID=UPI00131399CA|nr:type IV pilin N-terminal domain-containing protein [Natrialba sp. INN-245]MWV40637.1 type IV pilin [Natrialba sp. INN-245]